jgi:hypothetical protein
MKLGALVSVFFVMTAALAEGCGRAVRLRDTQK